MKSRSGVFGPKGDISGFNEKSAGRVFVIFCMNLLQQKILKIHLNAILVKNHALRLSGQNGPEWAQVRFFKFYEKLTLKTFLTFCVRLQGA